MSNILDRFRLDGRVAIVTGASGGIGGSFAVALAEAGADVVLASRRTDRLEEVADRVRSLGRRALVHQTDVTAPDDCDALVQAAVDAFGGVDVLVNNAGMSWIKPTTKETPDEFEDVVRLNLMGTYWCSKAFALSARPSASIVNISSNLALRAAGMPQAAYASSKAGVVALTRDLAGQWGSRRKIRVNALAPGYFESEMTVGADDTMTRVMSSTAPMGRAGTHEDLSSALIFLASDASSYITGSVIAVDGGLAEAGSMFGSMNL